MYGTLLFFFLQHRYINHPNVSNCISRRISADIPKLLHVDHLHRRFQDVVRDPYIFITVGFMVGSTQFLPHPTPTPTPTPTDISVTKVLPTFKILTAVLRCTCNVTLKRVRVTIVTVEKQSVLHYSASVVSYPTRNAHAPYCPISSSVVCLAVPYLSTLSHKRLTFL